jgi:hypothetical protein
MLRFLATIGSILWIVVGMAEIVSLAPPPVNNSPVNNTKAYDNCAKDYAEHPSLIGFFICKGASAIDRVHDDITAVSTLFIMIFTAVLSILNYSLARSTRLSAEAAKKAADVSEQALTVLERPRLFVEEPIISRDHHVTQSPHQELRYKFTNYGKTPAIVRFMEAVISIGDKPSPFWECFNGRIIVGAGRKEPIPIVNPRAIPAVDQTVRPDAAVILTIRVTYRDVFDWIHVNEYRFFRMGDRFVQIGGNENNRRYSGKLRDGEEESLSWSRNILDAPPG